MMLLAGQVLIQALNLHNVDKVRVNNCQYHQNIAMTEIGIIETENETDTKTCVETENETEIKPDCAIYYNIPLTNSEQDVVRSITTKFGVEYELVLAIMSVETKFDISAIGDNGESLGAMQIQPRWWGKYVDKHKADLMTLEGNVTVGCEILLELYSKSSDIKRTLNAYNTGDFDSFNGYSEKVLNTKNNLIMNRK